MLWYYIYEGINAECATEQCDKSNKKMSPTAQFYGHRTHERNIRFDGGGEGIDPAWCNG